MYDENKQHSKISSYRSEISAFHAKINGVPAGQHPIVTRLMQGICNTCPSKPRYTLVWDVEIVLNYIKNMPPSSRLHLTALSGKLAMLLALTNANRVSHLQLLDLNFKQVTSRGVHFQTARLSKTHQSGPPWNVTYVAFKECKAICPVTTMEAYKWRTADLRTPDQDTNPLFESVTSNTISKWIRINL